MAGQAGKATLSGMQSIGSSIKKLVNVPGKTEQSSLSTHQQKVLYRKRLRGFK